MAGQTPENEEIARTNSEVTITKQVSRKRKISKENWKRNVRQKARQLGKEYWDQKGKLHKAKAVKTVSCQSNCNRNCSEHFNEDKRKNIHYMFWQLDEMAKNHFYSKFVERTAAKRHKKVQEKVVRQYSYKYYFQDNDIFIQICQKFFLSTLNISERRIYYFFKNSLNAATGVASSPKQGKHIKNKTPTPQITEIINHINSFPRVESHYCRQSTSRSYLDSTLNVSKMYNLYREKCIGPLVKENVYRKVFNEEFNLAFHVPKKDVCDLCSEYEKKKTLNDAEKMKIDDHQRNKCAVKKERDFDRTNNEDTTAIITYDLQNVFSLPRAPVSNFFYKRKFSVFNLTGHCNLNKTTYCSIWSEMQSGRSGNDIASALRKILNKAVIDNPGTTKIILWSDSCVPQNKNRINSTMILNFLKDNPVIERIDHKYSTPGHSSIQEVDSVHSMIERHLRGISIYSPISLITQLLKMNYKNVTLSIMQLQPNDFFDFNLASQAFDFWIPFQKANHIIYERNDLFCLKYKTAIDSEAEIPGNLFHVSSTRRQNKKVFPIIRPFNLEGKTISNEKISDLKSMIKYMDPIDVEYYNRVFILAEGLLKDDSTTILKTPPKKLIKKSKEITVKKKKYTKKGKPKSAMDKPTIKN